MVNDSSTLRDRGQLILIGCLTLAFVVVSIGLLVNTTLYTESASPALSNAQIDNTETFDHETRFGTRGLIHRINHREHDRTESQLDENVTEAVANYSTLLAENYAQNEPAAVDVAYSPDEGQVGTRVIRANDEAFVDPGDPNEFFDGNDNRLGWFTVNVNVSRTDQEPGPGADPFSLVIENGTEQVEVVLYRNESGTDTNLTIETTHDTDERNVTCNPIRDRVLLDVMTGEVIADGCNNDTPLYSVADLDPPHTAIEVHQRNRFEGKWEFVTNGSDADLDSSIVSCTSDPDVLCHTPVIWLANVTTAFESDTVSFENDRNLTIYG